MDKKHATITKDWTNNRLNPDYDYVLRVFENGVETESPRHFTDFSDAFEYAEFNHNLEPEKIIKVKDEEIDLEVKTPKLH